MCKNLNLHIISDMQYTSRQIVLLKVGIQILIKILSTTKCSGKHNKINNLSNLKQQ